MLERLMLAQAQVGARAGGSAGGWAGGCLLQRRRSGVSGCIVLPAISIRSKRAVLAGWLPALPASSAASPCRSACWRRRSTTARPPASSPGWPSRRRFTIGSALPCSAPRRSARWVGGGAAWCCWGVQKEAAVGVPSCCRNSPVHKRGGAVVASAALTPSPHPASPPLPCPLPHARSTLTAPGWRTPRSRPCCTTWRRRCRYCTADVLMY